MGFDNKNSYWIDTFIKKYEESFKKVDLLDRKSEYWRFASPSIWYDHYINKMLRFSYTLRAGWGVLLLMQLDPQPPNFNNYKIVPFICNHQ